MKFEVDGVFQEINHRTVKNEMTQEQVELFTLKCQKAELKTADTFTHAISCAFSQDGAMPSHMLNLQREDVEKREELTPDTPPAKRRKIKYGPWLKKGMTLTALYEWMENRKIDTELWFEQTEIERIKNARSSTGNNANSD